jgi:hypothetical protein
MSELDPFENLHSIKKSGKKEKKIEKETKEDTSFVKDCIKEHKEKTRDDPKEKASLIFRIQFYGNNKRFGSYLKEECNLNFNESHLKGMSIEELQLQIEKINLLLSNKSNNNVVDMIGEGGLTFLENIITNKTKYKINGTTNKLFKDEHFLDLLELLKLKYNLPTIKLDPAVEILFLVVQTAFLTHQMNSVLDQFSSSTNLDEEVDEGDFTIKEVERNEN